MLVPAVDAARLVGPASLLHPKYRVQHNDFEARYRDLSRRILACSKALGLNSWVAYRASADGQLLQLADLMAVDGALALDTQFDLPGFGVEIATPARTTPFGYHALAAEDTQLQPGAADRRETRHRAAYRLCQARAGCQAIVVSQDGNIRLVRQHAGQVLFWSQLLF